MSRKLTYDSWLFGAAMIIVVLGIVMIYSASAIIATQRFGAGNSYHFMTRQLVWLFAGGALMMLLMHIDLTELVRLTEPGQYLVFPRILLFSGPGKLYFPHLPDISANLLNFHFD